MEEMKSKVMEEMKSKVYVLLDGEKITRCEGGYSTGNIQNIEEWTLIDEGAGDKYNLCQSHYFNGGLYTDDGICRWKYADGRCVLRTDAEIEEDRAAIPAAPSQPTNEERIADLEEALDMLLSGVTE